MIDFLFTSALFGRVVANNASVAGATGGCQAEVGSASAMAAVSILTGHQNNQDMPWHWQLVTY